ncbi:MAG: phosphate ABC transporter substrate-binding protein PstS [Solirubrobacteraceae bacterium]
MLALPAAVVAGVLGITSTTNAVAGTTLVGAGSTLVAPLVEDVFGPDFASKDGITVNYGGGGSGAGVTDISNKTVDFGASDAPLTGPQVAGCTGCVEIPWALAATGLSYNLPGVAHLNLSGPVIADIYLGTITNWDSPQIAALNKGETLPNLAITPVWRNDASGDSYVFSTYLSDVSSAWASKVGASTSPSYPVGTGEKGNSGVASVVASTAGAIGNNSWFYIRQDGLKAVAIENNAGNYIYPYEPNLVAAAALLKKVPTLSALSSTNAGPFASDLSLVDPPYSKPKKGKKPTTTQKDEAAAYPLATFTYVIARPDDANIADVKEFLAFALTSAEQAKGIGGQLQFAPLPSAVVTADNKAVAGL